MSLRSRRTRRSLVVLGAVVLVAGIGAGMYALRNVALDGEARDARQAGLAAYEAGDYPAALDGAGHYLQRFENRGATADDFLLYARARRRVELPNGRHLADSISALRRALKEDPGCDRAADELMETYAEAGYSTEVLALVEQRLAKSPRDRRLRTARCEVLEALGRFDESLAVARELDAEEPADFSGRFRTLRLLVLAQKPVEEVDAWIDGAVKANGGDPRFVLLRAAAAAARHDDAAARPWLDQVLAETKDTQDVRFVGVLVGQLDLAGRFDDALAALERCSGSADPDIRRERIRRLWYARRPARMLELLAQWDETAPAGEPEILAFRALALRATSRADEAQPIRVRLAARTDRAGRAWGRVVEQALSPDVPSDGRGDLVLLTEGSAANPGSALLRQSLGDAYAALGETDMAIAAWTRAAECAPAWAEPLVRISRAELVTGRRDLAAKAGRAALVRAPDDASTLTTCVRAFAAGPEAPDLRAAAPLLAALDSIEADAPAHRDEAIAIRADILARADPDQADRVLREALRANPPHSQQTLLALSRAAHDAKLPVATDLLEACERLHGATPELALTAVGMRAPNSDPVAALAVFDAARTRAGVGSAPFDWDVARARCLDSLGLAEAGPAWVAVSDAAPDRLDVQLGAMASSAVWSDRAAASKLIDRVHELTGDDAVTWRTARARWLLTAEPCDEAGAAEAASLLNAVVRRTPTNSSAHRLLAGALERLGNRKRAEEELRLAADEAPSDAKIRLDIARIAQADGRHDTARREIERVLSSGAGAEERERAAFLLASEGDLARSAEILGQSDGEAGSRAARTLLADLCSRLGQNERAISVAEALLERPDVPAVAAAARAYAAAGRRKDADDVLARLDALTAAPGEKELVRARFAAEFGPAGAAREWFARAAAAAPDRPGVWSERAAFAVTSGDADLLRAVLDDPNSKCSESVRFLAGVRDDALAAVRDPGERALLVAALGSSDDRAVITQAMRVAGAPAQGAESLAARARQLRRIADTNARCLVLQLLAADGCAAAGDLKGACEVASRAAAAFPNSEAALRQSAELLGRAGRWAEACDAALKWREKARRPAIEAETFVAAAFARTGRPEEAAARLAPIVEASRKRGEVDRRLLVLEAVALARAGRAADAKKALAGTDARDLALGIDPEFLGDAAGAAAWIELASGLGNAGDAASDLSVARAWCSAWERFGGDDLLARTRKALQPLTSGGHPSADALCMDAWLSQHAGDLEGARKGYEAALRADPSLTVARNNLAMVLADLGRWREAVEEASAAAKSSPPSPEILDTMAYALRKGREYGRAKTSSEEAIRLDPSNPEWHVGLAETLAANGELDAARLVAARVLEMTSEGGRVAAPLRERIEKLRR